MSASLCPRDGAPLGARDDVFGPSTKAQVCPRCAGARCDWATAQAFFTGLGLTLADLQVLVKEGEARPRQGEPLACTACGGGAMRPLMVKGVALDLCEACGAAWFDRGELARLSQGRLGADLEPTGVAGETSRTAGVFEMLWDCAFCDARALLGKTHRCCPRCGAQQDPTRRYFPPPGQEVAANHDYDGADRVCPACATPNGARAAFCRSCGSPLEGAQEVARVADRAQAQPRASGAAKPLARRRLWPWVLGAALALTCGFCGVAVFWTKEVPVTVTGHAWERTIEVEALAAVQEEAWCDALPGGASAVSRRREQRSTRQVPDGETCATRDVDRGDGTFERKEECRPKYRDEPVYDERCRFTVDRWRPARTLRAAGKGLSPAPAWPPVALHRTGTCQGCEREGARREVYTLELLGADQKPYTCAVPAAKWGAVADGTQRPLPIGVLTGAADCDRL